MYKMKIEWQQGKITPEMSEQILAKIDTMVSQGKTDGSHTRQYFATGFYAFRTWVDQASAQEYEAFLMQLTPNTPTSITIQPA